MQKIIYFFLLILTPFILYANDTQKYTLSTGDEIRILVYGERDLTLKIKVDDDGIISYPFLGNILIKGLSLGEVESKIRSGLKDGYLRNPNVNVSIIEYRPFFVNGQVKRPGAFPFQPGITVHKAITIAGGFTERASENSIYVIHNNSTKKIKINKDDRIKPGDTLSVEESFF
ncbi:MAG: polysaccharide biosynthesis/export family protein [Pseudomonadota bacterium]